MSRLSQSRLPKLASSLMGVGHLPIASGTWGSLVIALPGLLGSLEFQDLPYYYAVAAIFFLAVGLWSVPLVQPHWGKDPGAVVIDEAVGMAMVLSAPLASASPLWLLTSFLIFRVYDIAKPFPANVFNERTEAWAVIADDVVAAIYTVISIYVFQFVLHAMAPLLASF